MINSFKKWNLLIQELLFKLEEVLFIGEYTMDIGLTSRASSLVEKVRIMISEKVTPLESEFFA